MKAVALGGLVAFAALALLAVAFWHTLLIAAVAVAAWRVMLR